VSGGRGGVAEAHRAGVVALLGLPNAGKSTLLNRLLGEKVAIVSRRPQTTRGRLLGVLTRPGVQALLVDTPGLHPGRHALDHAMQEAAREAAQDCDVAVLLVAPGQTVGPEHAALHAQLASRGVPVLWVATQTDRRGGPVPPHALPGGERHAVSARTGAGVDALRERILSLLPEGPRFYEDDALTDRPLRWLAGELVREAGFACLHDEIPHALGVEVLRFDEGRADLVRIEANLVVERASQKRIVVGAGGAMVKEIGTRARHAIESLLGTRVHLALWVKVEPHWTRRRERVGELGYG